MPSIRLPINKKAAEAIVGVREQHGMDVAGLYSLAGWDADAQFATARARLKLDPTVSIHHLFVGTPDGIMHEYWSR